MWCITQVWQSLIVILNAQPSTSPYQNNKVRTISIGTTGKEHMTND